MIEKNIANWHLHMKGELAGGLDSILHDDCVFYSPIVFTAQKGKALTKMYLGAAGNTFTGSSGASDGTDVNQMDPATSKFKYIKEVLDGNQAVLEFETEIDGKYMNGVDIITWDDEGKIVEFKVMMRPLQAINLMHQKMQAMLEAMKK